MARELRTGQAPEAARFGRRVATAMAFRLGRWRRDISPLETPRSAEVIARALQHLFPRSYMVRSVASRRRHAFHGAGSNDGRHVAVGVDGVAVV